jgi:hypothetical protein
MRIDSIKKKVLQFVKRCQEYFRYNHPIIVKIKPDDDHDLYCLPLKYPAEIHLCKKWLIAYTLNGHEARKRIVHEFLHIAFKLPDNLPHLHYFSHPWKDALSKTVYEDMGKFRYFDWERILKQLEDNLLNPYWVEELVQNGRLGWW